MHAIPNRPSRVRQFAAAIFPIVAFAASARADIFQWEYINPADPSQGKQQSTTVCPDGAGVDAMPGADFGSYRNLTMAYLIGADLPGAHGYSANLTSADLSQANLTDAHFFYATLTDANLTGADIRGANFDSATLTGADFTSAEVRGASFAYTGITLTQLYSTASYQAHDLSGINLSVNNLASGNFAGQNLTNAAFNFATLTDADFTDAEVRGASFDKTYGGTGITLTQLYSTASYQAHDLSGINLSVNNLASGNVAGQNLAGAHFFYATLTDANLTGADIRGANFDSATLTGANFTGAEVRGASFAYTGITLTQLYSTASYQAHDLSGINLSVNNLASGNFAGQNLAGASLRGAIFQNASLVGANLLGADFSENCIACGFGGPINRTDLTAADLRDANLRNTNFQYAVLADANLSQADLTNAYLTSTDLRNADLRESDLSGAYFNGTLTGANFTGADVRRATFYAYVGDVEISLPQLYSTASYQAHDLSGINLTGNYLGGGNFAGQNLANANFNGATLTDADFTGADIHGGVFDAYNLEQHRLGTGITLSQLYSTASYQAKDLSGIGLSVNNLAGGNFAGQNLAGANFIGANLTVANFREANLSNAIFNSATLTDADFTDSEVRGASFGRFYGGTVIALAQLYSTASYQEGDLRGVQGVDLSGAITTNLIQPNGHMDGLDLDTGGLLVVRDYEDIFYLYNPRIIPITVDQHLAMGPGGTLRMVFEADAWDSTISFAPGIPVTLGGTLELTFANDVNLASQVGRTLDLFDWTGVNATGAFAVSSPYSWDVSKLYTSGEVTLTAVPEPASIALATVLAVFILRSRGRLQKTVVPASLQQPIPGENS